MGELKIKSSACELWTGYIDPAGYGRLGSYLAHRITYERTKGPIPDDLELDHLCRNRACVNPDHLEAVTHLENVRRGNAGDTHNRLKTHCPQEHEYTVENTYFWNGHRACRACRLDADKRWHLASNRS